MYENEDYLTLQQLMQLTKFRSATTIRKKIRSGELPKPIKLGDRSNRWVRSEVIHSIERHPRNPIYGGSDV